MEFQVSLEDCLCTYLNVSTKASFSITFLTYITTETSIDSTLEINMDSKIKMIQKILI